MFQRTQSRHPQGESCSRAVVAWHLSGRHRGKEGAYPRKEAAHGCCPQWAATVSTFRPHSPAQDPTCLAWSWASQGWGRWDPSKHDLNSHTSLWSSPENNLYFSVGNVLMQKVYFYGVFHVTKPHVWQQGVMPLSWQNSIQHTIKHDDVASLQSDSLKLFHHHLSAMSNVAVTQG